MATQKQPGKRAQLYIAEESSFGTPPTLLVTHAIRHLSASMDFNPYNRVYSAEKKLGPGRFALFDRRATAGGSVEGLLRPSGTINTLAECSPILKAAFGSVVNTALATTVASGGTTTGCTLTSGTGATVGASVLITCPDGKKRARFLASVAGAVVTWAPALPSGQQPANGAAVKLGTVYKLTSALAISLCMARYLVEADFTAGHTEILKGWVIDRLSLMFPAIEEPHFSASGPAQTKTDAPTIPAGFTQVGTNPPTAATAEVLIGTTAMNLLQLGFELTNGMHMRNDEIGFSAPTQAYRMGDRDISLSLDQCIEADFKAALYDLAMAGTLTTVFKQVGFTEGKIIAIYAPSVEFVPPTADVGDAEARFPFRGRVLEPTEDANGELLLGLL